MQLKSSNRGDRCLYQQLLTVLSKLFELTHDEDDWIDRQVICQADRSKMSEFLADKSIKYINKTFEP